ncbi:hypothetical protein LR48_Vigan01g169900 [Vigna angularis]|uniref:Dehydrodolichyl diphosphate synthase n=1 Tax=Phaseolus angularis TaxID=3914 RepID=A0A0L9TNH9_PHAAN|nr:Dehydrodolichyl diphosphate synthase [Vigna angularis]KOM32143.1 hypothetical protein LR48_Vigan01g169900 [Vigna angularis]
MHAVQECCKEKLNEVQALKEEKVTNGAFSKIDEGLKGNDFDLLSQDSCKEYRNAIKACSTEVESAARNDGLFENNIENHIGNDTEAETTLYNGLVELTEERKDIQDEVPFIKLADIEKNMYMAVAPDPDILIRSSGEARLSNFLLWQTTTCPLYGPTTLWPEIGLRHFIWAVLNFHRFLFGKQKETVLSVFLLAKIQNMSQQVNNICSHLAIGAALTVCFFTVLMSDRRNMR